MSDAPGYPHGIIECTAALSSDRIHSQKPEAFDCTQHVRAVPDNIHRFISEFLQNHIHFFGCYLKRRQKRHQFPEHLVFSIGLHNSSQLLLGNSTDLQEFLRVVFHDFQCLKSKLPENSICHLETDTFDCTGRKVSFVRGTTSMKFST